MTKEEVLSKAEQIRQLESKIRKINGLIITLKDNSNSNRYFNITKKVTAFNFINILEGTCTINFDEELSELVGDALIKTLEDTSNELINKLNQLLKDDGNILDNQA